MRIGVLGGSFNPIHIGHLILASEAARQLRLDRVLFIPANVPPHKEQRANPHYQCIGVEAKGEGQGAKIDAHHRVNMVKLAVKGNPLFAVSDIEIKRGGVSYTVDTLRWLKKMYKNAKLYLIIGSDSAASLHKWREADEIMRLATIAVAMRPMSVVSRQWSAVSGQRSVRVEMPLIDVSSSDIRARVKRGERVNPVRNFSSGKCNVNLYKRHTTRGISNGVKYLVPPAVEEYITKNKLYR